MSNYVVVISGSVGSGKTTVASALAEALGDASLLIFDHYEQYIQMPQDMAQWLRDGANPKEILVPKLKEDLLTLLAGGTVTDPRDGMLIAPAKYILLEEPSGREREEIRELVDLVVYVDTPQDVCVTRMIGRCLRLEVWEAARTFRDEPQEELVRQLDSVASWLEQYQRARLMYINVSAMVRQNADVIVDGMKPLHEIVMEILRLLKETTK